MNDLKKLLVLLPLVMYGCTTETITQPKESSAISKHKLNQSNSIAKEASTYKLQEENIEKRKNSKSQVVEAPMKVQATNHFFAYDSSIRDSNSEIEPATGGVLFMENNCILLRQGSTIKVPVFPSENSEWNASKNQMTINGFILPLGTEFTATGGQYESYDISKFKKVGNLSCIGNKPLEHISGSIYLR